MGQSVQVYVVQVWPAGPGFRAQVRPAQAEQALTFDDPLALLDYLRGPRRPVDLALPAPARTPDPQEPPCTA